MTNNLILGDLSHKAGRGYCDGRWILSGREGSPPTSSWRAAALGFNRDDSNSETQGAVWP